MDMNRHHLGLLAALDALLAEQNVTRAAERLHLSQPAASNALAQLRRVFGDPLLVRRGRDLVPTARALSLQPLVREALDKVDKVFAGPGRFDPAQVTRRMHLAVSDAVGQQLVPLLVQRLAEQAPGIRLRISAAGAEVPEDALGSGALDMVIGHHESVPPDLRAVLLYEQDLVAVVRRDHPVVRTRLSLAQFLATPQVVVVPHPAALEVELRRVFSAHRQPFQLAASVQHTSTAAAIAAQGDCLALMTERLARLYSAVFGLRVLRLPRQVQPPRVAVRAVWHERTHQDPAAVWFRQVLMGCAEACR